MLRYQFTRGNGWNLRLKFSRPVHGTKCFPYSQFCSFIGIIHWKFLSTKYVGRHMQFINHLVPDQFAGDRIKFTPLSCSIHAPEPLQRFSVFIGNPSGMNHIAAFVIIFHITDIWRKEIRAAFLSILPHLPDRPFFSVNMVAHASGIAVFRPAVAVLSFGAVMTVIKHHDVPIRAYHHAVLLVGPFKRIPHRPEKIVFHIFFRPAFRIPQNPVEGSCLKVNINHRILMPAGKCDGIRLLIVPHCIVMEPVMGRCRSGICRRTVVRQNLPVVPGSHNFSCLTVDENQNIFHGIPVRNLGQHQDITIFHLKGIMVVTARQPVFPVYFSVNSHFIHTAHIIRQLNQPVCPHQKAAVCKPF